MGHNDQPDNDNLEIFDQTLSKFSKHVNADASIGNKVFPVAHPMNMGIDGTSGPISGRNAGETLWLKIPDNEQRGWINGKNAVAMAENAGKAGIAPGILASDSRTGALLQEYLDDSWRFAIVVDFRRSEIVEKAISATRQLHGLEPLPDDNPVFDRIESMRNKMENGVADGVTAAATSVPLPENYQMMRDHVLRIGEAFKSAGNDTRPCHIENSLSNFMIGPDDALKLVDFDRATNDDPHCDLGTLCNEYCRVDEDVARAVEIYSGRTDEAIIARVKLHMIAASFYWGMWGKVSNTITTRSSIEFYKYGENQFMRCAANISRWDVDALIRTI